MSPECTPEEVTFYQNLIGILQWGVELRRIDINLEVALMLRHLAAPRKGHLTEVLHIFRYLKKYSRSKIVFEETMNDWGANMCSKVSWSDFYPDATEPIPLDAPEP